jgi:hypothetical protein
MNEPMKAESTAIETIAASGSTALAERSKAEIQARYMVAMARPRNLSLVRQKLMHECERDTFCESAWYNIKNRGEGFTIGFAQTAKRLLGNLDVRETIIFDDEDQIITEVTVTDIENNNTETSSVVVKKTVERKKLGNGEVAISSRVNSYGEVVYLRRATDEEFMPKKNAAVSKAKRNLIIACVPRDFLDECKIKIKEGLQRIARNEAKRDPDEQKRRITDGFATLNISVDKIELYLGHEIDSASPAELQDLRDIFSAVRNGETTFHALLEDKLNPKEEEKEEQPKKSKMDKLKDAVSEKEGAK